MDKLAEADNTGTQGQDQDDLSEIDQKFGVCNLQDNKPITVSQEKVTQPSPVEEETVAHSAGCSVKESTSMADNGNSDHTEGNGIMPRGDEGQCSAEPKTQGACSDEPITQGACSDEPITQGACSDELITQGACSAEPITQGACLDEPITQGACSAEPIAQGACTAEPEADEADLEEARKLALHAEVRASLNKLQVTLASTKEATAGSEISFVEEQGACATTAGSDQGACAIATQSSDGDESDTEDEKRARHAELLASLDALKEQIEIAERESNIDNELNQIKEHSEATITEVEQAYDEYIKYAESQKDELQAHMKKLKTLSEAELPAWQTEFDAKVELAKKNMDLMSQESAIVRLEMVEIPHPKGQGRPPRTQFTVHRNWTKEAEK